MTLEELDELARYGQALCQEHAKGFGLEGPYSLSDDGTMYDGTGHPISYGWDQKEGWANVEAANRREGHATVMQNGMQGEQNDGNPQQSMLTIGPQNATITPRIRQGRALLIRWSRVRAPPRSPYLYLQHQPPRAARMFPP